MEEPVEIVRPGSEHVYDNMDVVDYSESEESDGDDSSLDEAELYAAFDPVQDEESEDDDDEEDILYNPSWQPPPFNLRILSYTQENKILVDLPGDNEPFDWYTLLMEDLFLENVVKATNEYAWELFLQPNLTPRTRIKKWRDMTVQELKKFIGLLFHMGTVRVNRFSDYWKKDRMFNFGFVREQMSRDRFLLIMKCLNFCKISKAEQSQDQLHKVRLIVNYFNDKMNSVYYPRKELSLDIGTALWRGRLYFRQNIPRSYHKNALKIYSLCESDGPCVAFTVFSGKDGDLSGKNHASKVVMHLMRGKLGLGHSLFMDSFYNSFYLAAKLLYNCTYCTGTLQPNRKNLPEDVISAKLKMGQKIERCAEGVMVAKWCDNRQVLYISTEFENNFVVTSDKHGRQREKPLPIIKYNAHMKRADRNDQMMSYYTLEHKSLKWYKKIFVHFIQLIMINSFKLYNIANPQKKTDLYDFRLAVINKILPAVLPPPPQRPTQKTAVRHVLARSNKRNSKGDRFTRKRCRQCVKDKKKSVTVFVCAQCPGEPGLCPIECFDKWHAE